MRAALQMWTERIVPGWMICALYLEFAALPTSIAASGLANAMLLLGFLAWRAGHPVRVWLPRWVWLPFVAFLAVAVLSALVNPEPLRGLWLVSRDYRVFLLPWLVFLALRWGDERRLLTVLAVAVGAVAAIGVVQHHVGQLPLKIGGVNPIDAVGNRYRAEGLFNNPMTYSGVLLVLAPLFAALAQRTDGRARWGWALAAALAGVGVVVSVSRNAWVGLAGAFAMFTLGLGRRTRNLVWGALAVTVVAGGLLLATTVSSDGGRLPGVLARLSPAALLSGAEQRLYLWETGWIGFRDNPWLGVGLNNHYPAILPYQEQVSARHGGYDFGRSVGASPHNVFLSLLFELGLFGLGAYLWLWGAVFVWTLGSLLRAPPEARWERAVLWGIAVGFTGSILASVFEENFFDGEVQTLLTVLMGLAFHVGHRVRTAPTRAGPPTGAS